MNNKNQVVGTFEPEVSYTFLPGCRACGGAHPLARKPVMPENECPDCGVALGPVGQAKKADSTWINTPSIVVAKTCFAISRILSKISKRI